MDRGVVVVEVVCVCRRALRGVSRWFRWWGAVTCLCGIRGTGIGQRAVGSVQPEVQFDAVSIMSALLRCSEAARLYRSCVRHSARSVGSVGAIDLMNASAVGPRRAPASRERRG